MISGGNATVYVSNLDAAVQFYAERLGLRLTNRFGQRWATAETGPSYWTTDDARAGLTVGLHPHSPQYPAPGTSGGVGFGLETYTPVEDVAARLRDRGVRVDREIIRYEAGNLVTLVDQDGLPMYINEFPPEMLDGERDLGSDRDQLVSGGHAIVFVSDMDAGVRFYTETLGLKLTSRFGDNVAFVEAGRLVIAIHPKSPRTPDPGAKGSVMLGLTIDEPIERVVSRLTGRGVRITGPVIRGEGGDSVEIEDPSGNAIYLWEETPKAAEEAHIHQAVLAAD
jgi:catechol 2,3-dioxygenase-like lactoylglutathione lyase family enzyme